MLSEKEGISNLKNQVNGKGSEFASKTTVWKTLTTRDLEVNLVAQLKTDIESFSRPSITIEKLNEKRKQHHESLLLKLANDLQKVNLKAENDIRISSEEVRAHIKFFQDKTKDTLTKIDVPERGKPVKRKSANSYEFYQDLMNVENERCKITKNVFQNYAEEMRKTGFLLPYQLQNFIEHEILKMNQLLLNNRRCYEDLHLHLTLTNEETFKSFMDQVFCIRDKWIRHKIEEAHIHMLESNSLKGKPEECVRLELKGNFLALQLISDGLNSTCKVEDWSKNISSVADSFENFAKKMVELYRKTLDCVLNGFTGEMEEMKKELNSLEIINIEERIIRPIRFQVEDDQTNEVNMLEVSITPSTGAIKNSLIFYIVS